MCETLIACASEIAPAARDEYLKVYGEDGTCWGVDLPIGEPAFGISITEVEANQGTAVLIGQAGGWVGPGDRNAPLVAGRDTLIRLQHTVDNNWTPREIGAILHLRDGSGDELAPRARTFVVEGSSDPDVLESEFYFSLSAAEAEAGLSYWVELIDVSGGLPIGLVPGINTTPADFELVGFDATPVELQIVLVPVAYTFPVTPTYVSLSDADLELIGNQLYQAHPVQSVSLEVHAAYERATELGHSGELLAGLQTLRSQDGAPANVYYHALIDVGAPSLGGAAGVGLIGSDSQAGADNRVAATIWISGSESAGQIVHELGHTHGLAHVACPNEESETPGSDPSYPYAGGGIGVHGYAVLDGLLYRPSTTADYMTHCSREVHGSGRATLPRRTRRLQERWVRFATLGDCEDQVPLVTLRSIVDRLDSSHVVLQDERECDPCGNIGTALTCELEKTVHQPTEAFTRLLIFAILAVRR